MLFEHTWQPRIPFAFDILLPDFCSRREPTRVPRLGSWKEIAAHLKVDVKTAQRWEKLRALPVHRVPGAQRSAVFSYTEEIDQWLVSKPPEPDASQTNRPPILAIVGLATLAVAALSAFLYINRNKPLSDVSLRGQQLVGLDKTGASLWSYPLPALPALKYPQRVIRTVDWNRTGHPDALVSMAYDSPALPRSELLCLSGDGTLRWRWKPASSLLDFNGEPFEDSWQSRELTTVKVGGRDVPFVSIVNELRWASAVYRIDPDGKPNLHFANHGYILRLITARVNGEDTLLAAGINNAVNRPFVAWLGPTDPPSVTPPLPGPARYRYANAPTGLPRAYALLPNSELNLVRGEPYPIPVNFFALDSLLKLELFDPTVSAATYLYEFDHALRPLRALAANKAIPLHRQLETLGLLKHTAANCPELDTPHVIDLWTRPSGWTQIRVPIGSQLNLQ